MFVEQVEDRLVHVRVRDDVRALYVGGSNGSVPHLGQMGKGPDASESREL